MDKVAVSRSGLSTEGLAHISQLLCFIKTKVVMSSSSGNSNAEEGENKTQLAEWPRLGILMITTPESVHTASTIQ